MQLESQSRAQLKRGVEDNTSEAARLLIDENNIGAARKHLDWARMAEEVLKSERRPPQSLYVAGIFALICLSLVGLSWSLHKSANPLLLDIDTDGVSIHLRSAWVGNDLAISAQHLSLDNVERVQAGSLGIDAPFEFLELEGSDIALDQLTFPAGTRLELRRSDKGFTLLIHDAIISGSIRVRQAWLKLAGKDSLLEQNIAVPMDDFPPEFVRFTASAAQWPVRLDIQTDAAWHLPRLQTDELLFSREDQPDSGRFLSTIQKGSLKFPEVAREIEVLEADLLQLTNTRSARLIVSQTSAALRIQFQGEVDTLHAGPEGFVKNHTPTWLEYFYHHQQLAFFWSALVFLWGLLWKLRNFW